VKATVEAMTGGVATLGRSLPPATRLFLRA
jgi:hypothetical protein